MDFDDIVEPNYLDALEDAQRDAAAAAGGAGAPKDGAPVPGGPPKKKGPRPKLTIDNLRAPSGLKDVFDNFPRHFAEGFGGRGNEVRDLRRLIEMYQRWQLRVFPGITFDEYIAKLEAMSSSMVLRTELRELRQNLPLLLDPPEAPEEGGGHGLGGGGGDDDLVPPPMGEEGMAPYDEGPDDEELMELMQAQLDPAAEELWAEVFGESEAPAPAAPADRSQTAPAAALAAQAAQPGEDGDDEMLDIWQELEAGGGGGDSLQEPGMQGAPAGQHPAAGASDVGAAQARQQAASEEGEQEGGGSQQLPAEGAGALSSPPRGQPSAGGRPLPAASGGGDAAAGGGPGGEDDYGSGDDEMDDELDLLAMVEAGMMSQPPAPSSQEPAGEQDSAQQGAGAEAGRAGAEQEAGRGAEDVQLRPSPGAGARPSGRLLEDTQAAALAFEAAVWTEDIGE